QDVLKVKSKPRKFRNGHHFPFCGIFRCTCGSMMTAQWAKGHGGLYRYYRCTRKNGLCSEPYVREEQLVAHGLDLLRPLGMSDDESAAIRRLIDEEATGELEGLDAKISEISEKVTVLDEKLRKLTRLLIDEVLDEGAYKAAKEEIIVEKKRLKGVKE